MTVSYSQHARLPDLTKFTKIEHESIVHPDVFYIIGESCYVVHGPLDVELTDMAHLPPAMGVAIISQVRASFTFLITI